ncbi:MAG: biotin/lipoate A/B protein ligase family protein [Bacteroidota bacterium]|nr:biotin/lipoate A/B protein ligase family protein [Bacteroidota bacterium]
MHCISLDTTDPCFNLAVDEYLLRKSQEEYLILGINDRSVIVGKHQVAHRETDTKFVLENNIPVIRRISGGGTVFHDSGNLNFSFILNSEPGKQIDFAKYTLPVINFLNSVGVNAKLENKSDIRVNGLKISGNSEHVFHNRVLHHGTLLFNTDLTLLKRSIRSEPGRYETRAVTSNPSQVENIINVLNYVTNYVIDINEFRSLMMDWFLKNYSGAEYGCLSDEDKSEAGGLADSKYRTWEWNYAYGPEYYFNNSFLIKGDNCCCRLHVKDSVVWECNISGSRELGLTFKDLIGCRHMVEDFQKVLDRKGILEEGFDIYNLF